MFYFVSVFFKDRVPFRAIVRANSLVEAMNSPQWSLPLNASEVIVRELTEVMKDGDCLATDDPLYINGQRIPDSD